MKAARPPESWPLESRAEAVLRVIHEAVDGIRNPRWKVAAQAALRVPADKYPGAAFDSLAGRFRRLATLEGASDHQVKTYVERYRGYWMAAAAHLAERVDERFSDLNRSVAGWSFYRSASPQAPPTPLELFFDRTEVLYQFEGLRGVRSLSHRWVTAHKEVDRYEPVGWYYSDPDAPVEIEPIANCHLEGPLRELPQGGRSGTLKFARQLKSGEQYFFAYAVHFNSDKPCRPAILYEARSLGMTSLTIRAQFDATTALPPKCWFVDVASHTEASITPPDDAPQILEIAPNGFVEHEFEFCEPGRKYGIRWEWDADSSGKNQGGVNSVG